MLIAVAFLLSLAPQGGKSLEAIVQRARKGDLAAQGELQKRGEPGARALLGLLEDKSLAPRTRYMAANALGAMRYKKAVPELVELLAKDSVETVRRCCASALGFIGDKSAIPALEKAAKNDPTWYPDRNTGGRTYYVRFRAREALARIRGEPLPKLKPAAPGKPFAYEPKTGTAVTDKLPWAATIEEALARAKKEKRLVLATVVAVQDKRFVGGYTDATKDKRGLEDHPWGNVRAAQIDAGLVKERMMLASMFADARVAAAIRKRYVPVRVRLYTLAFEPTPGASDPLPMLGTAARDIGAPAIVIAGADGRLRRACGRMGVFAVELMRVLVAEKGGAGKRTKPPPKKAPHGGRLETWTSVVPLGLKKPPATTERRAPRKSLDSVLAAAARFLLRQQAADGSWPDPFVDMHPSAGPGSQYDRAVARTALCVDALMKMQQRAPEVAKKIAAAIAKGTRFVGAFCDDPEPWIWQATYALHLQVELLEAGADAAARRRAAKLVELLATMQSGGGWSYMSPPRIHSFNTAPVLLALTELRDMGIEVPAEVMAKADRFLESLRRDGEPREFAYAGNVRHRHLGSSSCRTALCELALRRHRKSKDRAPLRRGVELFFEHEPAVRRTTKIFESYFSPSAMHDAYHYFFGHFYVARALRELPRRAARKHAERQIGILLGQVELDGSFVDAQMQGKAYSTAMALLTFAELLPLVKE